MNGGWRIGVDIGGTFTDVVVVGSDAVPSVFKVPSVTANPAEGVLAGIRLAAESLGLGADQLLEDCALFVHGSTIATNAVLERHDPPVALLTTAGFRDSIELRRGMRETPWRHRDPSPPVLAPRYLRLPLRGRLDSRGDEIEMLSEDDVVEAAHFLEANAVESVAICLLHSYANPSHEQQAANVLRRFWRGEWISVSSDISPLSGEYERASTAVVNAYVAPRTVGYLRALDRDLRQMGLGRPLYLVQNNGGLLSVDQIATRPAALLLSGPAAGAGALAYYGRAIGSDNLISMEIGGTSCDVILVDRGRVAVHDHFQVAGYHLALPSIEVHTVGAGGGTIAGVDGAGMLFVGPRGAGAEPGPAAYGKGGSEPTVTDAQLVLGRLRPGPYAGGSITFDLDCAWAAVERNIARPLGLDVESAAAGIVALVEQKLLGAVQRISTERGYDTRDFVLVAAGGAGPLHGAAVGRLLGCRRVYIPRLSGVFCALGMLHSDVRHDLVGLYRAPLDSEALEGLHPIFDALETEARTLLATSGFQPHEMRLEREIDLHYVGQQWDTRVVLGDAAFTEESLRAGFEREYERLYGHLQPDGGIEITKVRVIAFGTLPRLSPAKLSPAEARSPYAGERRRVFVGGRDGWAEIPVYDGSDLRPGDRIDGPLLVEEATMTLLAAPGDMVEIDAAGDFVIHLAARESAQ